MVENNYSENEKVFTKKLNEMAEDHREMDDWVEYNSFYQYKYYKNIYW